MKNEIRRVVPIVLATDAAFLPYCSVTVSSIRQTASVDYDYHIYVFHESLMDSDQDSLEAMSRGNVQVSCVDISMHVQREIMYETGHYPRSIYFRFLIPQMLPMHDKVLYLDSDVVAVTDVAELWETDLGGMVIGAVPDCPHNKQQLANGARIGLKIEPYFNSGVMLINCRAFEKERIQEKCYDFFRKHQDLMFPDQDALNLFCKDRVHFLPVRWNLMMNYIKLPYHIRKGQPYNTLVDEAMTNIGLIHYAGQYKPLSTHQIGLNRYFWRSATESPLFFKIFNEWIDCKESIIDPLDLFKMIGDTMSTGRLGWRGLAEAFYIAVCSRLRYLKGRKGRL